MLPTMRRRSVIVLAMMIGAMAWTSIYGLLSPVDGSSGVSLMSSRIGTPGATLLVAVTGLVGLGLGLIVSVMGNPLGGVFAVAAGLSALAIKGGSIDGWMLRSDLPGDYACLMMGVLIWQTGVVIILYAVGWLRSPLRALWPALAYDDHLGVDIHLRFPQLQAWSAGGVCAVCGLGVGCVLIRTSDVGQVIAALLVSFGIGGLVAGVIFPRVNPIGILFSPAMVAIAAYTYMWTGFDNSEAVLRAWYGQQLPGIALALPIHYISAGVGGAAAGVGMSQVIEATNST